METAWTFEVTADKLATLQLELEWALQRQNQRFANAMPTMGMSLTARRRLLLGVAVAVGLVALFGRRDRWPTAGIVLAAFAVVMAAFLPQLRAWSRRTAGAMITRRAQRILRPVMQRAPYTIEYRLSPDQLVADIHALNTHRVLSLAEPTRVLATPHLVVAFRRRHSLNPLRIIYVTEQRDALLAAFRERLAMCEVITGPAEGYAPPVPEARLT